MGWIADHISQLEATDLLLLAKQVELAGAAGLEDDELRSRLYCLVVPEESSETAAIQGICENLLVPTTGDPRVDLGRARWQLWHEVSKWHQDNSDGKAMSLPEVIRALSPAFKERMNDLASEKQRLNRQAFMAGVRRPELIPFVVALKGIAAIAGMYQRRKLFKTCVIPLIVFHTVATQAALAGDVPAPAFGETHQLLLDLKMQVSRTEDTPGRWFFADDIPAESHVALRTDSRWGGRPNDEECLIAIDHRDDDDDDFVGILVTSYSVLWTEEHGSSECELSQAVVKRQEPQSWWKEPEMRMGRETFPYLVDLDPVLIDVLNNTFARLTALRG